MGLDGRFMQVNQAVCRMFGYSEEELSGLTFQRLTHHANLHEGLDLFRDMVQGQKDHG
ncbi:MAG: PAS domain S-box protein [Desulfomonilaceae bacterium]|nr:PAS domain S-box protein [Desulfomonilaceae bacterium]